MSTIQTTNYLEGGWLEKVNSASVESLMRERESLEFILKDNETKPYEYIEDSRVKHKDVISWQEVETTRPSKDGWYAVDFEGYYQDGYKVKAGAYRREMFTQSNIESNYRLAVKRLNIVEETISAKTDVWSVL